MKIIGFDLILCCLMVMICPAWTRGENRVQNGSFEQPVIETGFNYGLNSVIDGSWTVCKGNVDLCRSCWVSAGGQQSLELNGTISGGICQTLSTTSGAWYQLHFAFSANPAISSVYSMQIYWNNTLIDILGFNTSGRSPGNMGWSYQNYYLKTDNNQTLLKFLSNSNGTNGPTIDDISVTPINGEALSFDGQNDYARTINTPATGIPTGNAVYTEELWLNISGFPDYGNGYNGFILSRGTEGWMQGSHIVLINHHIGLTHWGMDRDTGIAVEMNRWYHIATTWDGTVETLYLDGQLVWQEPLIGGLNIQPSSITLGRHNNYSNYFFQGQMDEVRIWKTIRSAEEIASNYNRQVDPANTGLVAYWRIDESNGTILKDSSVSINDMELGSGTDIDAPTRIASGVTLNSPCAKNLIADLNFDCQVNTQDLQILANAWLADCVWPDTCQGADVNRSGRVDLSDFVKLSSEWMK